MTEKEVKLEPINFGDITEKTLDRPKEKGIMPEEKKVEPIYTSKLVSDMILEANKNALETVGGLNAIIMGKDGTGKTGIAAAYCAELPKKSIFIDFDGGDMKLMKTYHNELIKSGKITVLHPLVISEEPETKDVSIDYIRTFSIVKGILKYVKDNAHEYSAIVMDGLSDLLKFAENQMRMEKHIMADGGVDMRYWKNRNQRFVEVLEAMKHIQGIDKIYISHEDFITNEKSAAIKIKVNQMMQQRIICRRVETKQPDGTNLVEFVAKIDKSKYNIAREGKEEIFATIKNGIPKWNASEIFKDL